MSSLEDHCQDSINKFGDAYVHVHLWLDEFASVSGILSRHRKFRHHLEGVEQCKKLFVDNAAEVARLHVLTDLKLEGWNESDRFPINAEDYKHLGLW